ncbi:cytochrome c1 [Tahibacter amnicola]|uniref:Cytochrome c1 n=1 Tax=Tahibacter amnicola TaxID=2976241 RepID=A0ABY6BI93_9GAMM|nr:cytochrome c1 [Tahibacter amnicola]UXI69497.1 cytochrome c1 [Tahibacter amnicola]
MIKDALTKIGLTLAVALTAASPAAIASSGGGDLQPAGTRVDNIASLQRGAKLYFNYCIGCHSLQYMRYSRIGEDLGLSEDVVMKNLNFTGAKYGETIVSSMPAADAERWFGKAPPDLSLEARAKGPDWIYTYLKSFYIDPARPVGWNNSVFPGASMPNVLWELQGTQHAVFEPKVKGEESCSGTEGGCKNGKREVEHCKEGQKELDGKCLVKFEIPVKGTLNEHAFEEAARDLTAFLQYVGEPAALKRQKLGVWVLLYLSVFTFLAWLLKKEYWKDVH